MSAHTTKNLENRCLLSFLASLMACFSYSLFRFFVPTVRKPQIEEDLAKLTSWFRKIQGRDFFPGKRSEEAMQLLTRCRQMLDTFTHAVYTAAGLSPQDE